MTLTKWSRVVVGIGVIGWVCWSSLAGLMAAAGADALLHPIRIVSTRPAPGGCSDAWFTGAGVRLRGWNCAATGERRGTLVYLHGVADNRGSATGIIQRFRTLGYDVVAYDSRAHGESGGDACTYGFYEKRDLGAVIATLPPGPVVLMGMSLGAAVALQHAPDDPRVTAVVAAESFSDIRTAATERAPSFFLPPILARAFTRAERDGHFTVDDVSPERAARRIQVPVLLIHGLEDSATPPDHSRRIYAALTGPKQLHLVRGAGHTQSLGGSTMRVVEDWLATEFTVFATKAGRTRSEFLLPPE